MRVLALDPGYERLGIAVLEKNIGGKEQVIFSECFQTAKTELFINRLHAVGVELRKIITEFLPEAVAIESLFFTNNQKTAMHVAEVRGVIMYEAANHGLLFSEFTPGQIKNAVTGDGRADKKQIFSMIPKLVKINKKIDFDDEYDAIAIGLTFLAGQGYPQAQLAAFAQKK
ncbi:TPA: crossover junction endodeoxyribonuclease RuvC [Candidatus Taylorbacteria bacterium]|nr:crossover junction endodeoxyribonuclease RuvC [Candidatus Taylorbacteria bacterium]